MALCKVMIIGNLGSDPEMRYTPNNRAVTQFNVAVNQSTKNQQTGEWVEETLWLRVEVSSSSRAMALSLKTASASIIALIPSGVRFITRLPLSNIVGVPETPIF